MGKKNITLHDSAYGDVHIGDTFSFTKKITSRLVDAFATLTHDKNPLHVNTTYARTTEFGGRIAHGMLLGSFFSTLVGMLCPGKRALYLSQDLQFRLPLTPGTTVIISGEVTHKFDALKVIEIATYAKGRDGAVYVDGRARVKVRDH
ncbi:MAG: MaoC family dehydratase [Parcubacteria group bacterium]|nr:MaoC family dehydratase [Parcubacteria group bacterium]